MHVRGAGDPRKVGGKETAERRKAETSSGYSEATELKVGKEEQEKEGEGRLLFENNRG